MKNLLYILIVSAIPVLEQRFSIPYGILKGIHPMSVFIVSVIGSLIPFPFIYFLITPVFEWIKKNFKFGHIIEKLEKRTLSKGEQIKKYEAWGLLIFVGIPLPGTGIWTGTLAAVLLGLKFRQALLAVLGGSIMAGTILTLGLTGSIAFFKKIVDILVH